VAAKAGSSPATRMSGRVRIMACGKTAANTYINSDS
jgi:hypothetical protein